MSGVTITFSLSFLMKKACSIVSEALLDAVRVFVGVFDFMLCIFL